MIAPERFIASSDDREAWLAARRTGVTATEVAKAATPAGFRDAVEARHNPAPVDDNPLMEFGRDHEPWLALWVKQTHGIMPNRWLIAAEHEPLHMATPDGLSLDHGLISEIKTGGKDVSMSGPPIQHRRQVQWQLYCTGATECVYAFMLRREVNGVLVPAWLEPIVWVIGRDEKMIAELVDTAGRLLGAGRMVAA